MVFYPFLVGVHIFPNDFLLLYITNTILKRRVLLEEALKLFQKGRQAPTTRNKKRKNERTQQKKQNEEKQKK